MAIHLLSGPARADQVVDMLSAKGDYIKVAVDIERGVLAGGGVMHADCQRTLLDDGSRQEDVWGASWYPKSQTTAFESLINIRPDAGNRTLEVNDPGIRTRIESVTLRIFGHE